MRGHRLRRTVRTMHLPRLYDLYARDTPLYSFSGSPLLRYFLLAGGVKPARGGQCAGAPQLLRCASLPPHPVPPLTTSESTWRNCVLPILLPQERVRHAWRALRWHHWYPWRHGGSCCPRQQTDPRKPVTARAHALGARRGG